ncbi:MAG TPA: ATP-dependent helicase HrpB [Gammaproteobacteria bacterium]|nr:ATP-dependent helicase HrpB [Gammaproteobacteria bacterium]
MPITPALPEILRALAEHSVVIVQAPPGAGKSTVLPLALLKAEWLKTGKLLMLEPRRLAARAVAQRMAANLGERTGETVGYRTRLEQRVGPNTRIEVITEGILARMLQSDPALEGVAGVLFDEFHERSLHADLGWALCDDMRRTLREDLRVLIMSATLDIEGLTRALPEAPVIAVEGAIHPVETRYIPRTPGKNVEDDVAVIARRALREDTGDLLVFLPGAAEIRRTRERLGGLDDNIEVLPLYGDLTQAEQDRALTPSTGDRRKVVLATSIAETSLTLEGIHVVIDAGLMRRAQFDPNTGMSRLVTTRVSRAAANQRRGRAGRLGPGICYRLWTEHAGQNFMAHTPPEILEADLCPLALELANWGVTDPASLDWITAPPEAAYAQARDLLRRLGAIDDAGRITPHGREMSRLGLHPRLAHMLERAKALKLQPLALSLAAILSERDVLKPISARRSADIHVRLEALAASRSPQPAYYTLDRGACERVEQLVSRWRQELGLPNRREDLRFDPKQTDMAGLLLAHAYPDRIARRRAPQGGTYVLSNGRGAVLPADDALGKEEFLVAAELDSGGQEARIYLAAPISQQQIEQEFKADCRSSDEVYWDARTQAVLARRRKKLFELTLTENTIPIPADAGGAAMIEGIRALGLDCLPWDRETRNWQARVQLFKRLKLPEARDWPDVSDATLLVRLEEWLAPFLSGISRRDQLGKLDLGKALASQLTWAQQKQLDTLAPTHIAVPSGSRVALDYCSGEQPVLAVKLQEIFGLHETPRVAGGHVPVVMTLLSPARRPVQTTQDLASFWRNGYPEIRKELKGRYPKHYWPDDPYTAVPTRRVRPSRK